MKLKALFEYGDINRPSSWYEPDDDDQPDDEQDSAIVPFELEDGTKIQLRIEYMYRDDNDHDNDYQAKKPIEVTEFNPISVILPSGREVEIGVARQQLGHGEDPFPEDEVSEMLSYFLEKKWKCSVKMPQAPKQKAPPAQAAPVAPQGDSMSQAPAKQGAVSI